MPAALLSRDEVAEILGVTLGTVKNLINRGELRIVQIGTRVMIDPADLDDFIDQRKTYRVEDAS